MFFEQVLNRDLGCASYILGDGGEAIVVDPRWDVEIYREVARREGARITHVVDTHFHADHVSGRARLAALTGAAAHRPATEPDEGSADALVGGAELAAGSLRVRAVPTPGHRPEHLALAVTDLARGAGPWLALTGDSLLVGDLARPDLAVSPELGARQLHDSLQGLLGLGDHVEVWPGHVGGSLCGGPGLSGKTSSTIGFERRHNELIERDVAAFVAGLLAKVPPRPPNLARIVELNRSVVASELVDPPTLGLERLRAALDAGATVVDGRSPAAYDGAHIAGSINLPASSRGIGTRAGWAIGVHEPVVIVADELDAAHAMACALLSVGLSPPVGVAVADPDGWRDGGLPTSCAERWDVAELASGLERGAVSLIDVRDELEWRAGHVPGSLHLPLHELRDGRGVGLQGAGGSGVVAVACAAGGRAVLAASLLRRAGADRILRVTGGGIADLAAHGIRLTAGA